MFELYVGVIKRWNSPILLYTNMALPYNKLPLNPRHNCKHCGNKL